MSVSYTGDGITFADGSSIASGYTGFKNRIINGAMMIDERNAGASVALNGGVWTLDRWQGYATQASKATIQQNSGSVTPPNGFKKYLGFNSLSSYSVISSDIFTIRHLIEGYNIADLNWGTASAKTVTLSFWARSSLTGTFAGGLTNQGQNRSYGFSYTISSANTWEYKTIVIPGDQTGTWATDNTRGIDLFFSMGMGSTYTAPSNGSWLAGNYYSGPGGTSVVGTSGATFYITGVQLEAGSTATSFDFRPYGTELALCQRYYWKSTGYVFIKPIRWSTTSGYLRDSFPSPTTMRSVPTLSINWVSSGGGSTYGDLGNDWTTKEMVTIFVDGATDYAYCSFTATAEL